MHIEITVGDKQLLEEDIESISFGGGSATIADWSDDDFDMDCDLARVGGAVWPCRTHLSVMIRAALGDLPDAATWQLAIKSRPIEVDTQSWESHHRHASGTMWCSTALRASRIASVRSEAVDGPHGPPTSSSAVRTWNAPHAKRRRVVEALGGARSGPPSSVD